MLHLRKLKQSVSSATCSTRCASSLPDYVVVGAGSAGCVISSRLAEAGKSVILLEAGANDRGSPTDFFLHMPTALAWPMSMRKYNWDFKVKLNCFITFLL